MVPIASLASTIAFLSSNCTTKLTSNSPKYELPKEEDRRLVTPKHAAPPTSGHQFGDRMPVGKRPLDQVTCYKCQQTGHYANKVRPNPRFASLLY